VSLLVLSSRRIVSRQSGYDLRVANLCAHLPGEAHLVIAPLQPDGATGSPARGGDAGLHTDGIFASVRELSPVISGPPSARRHLRLSQDHNLRVTHPVPFARAQAELHDVVRDLDVTCVVVFGNDVAELAATLGHIPVVLDVCDSNTLTLRRALVDSPRPSRGRRRWKDRLALLREGVTESRYPKRFARVVAISDPDARAVEGRRGRAGSVVTIPNGVDEAFLGPLSAPGTRRGVAFWGNLAFGPNRDALWFFVHDVWLPILRAASVELCIVGAGAPPWLVELAATEPGIVLTGFVDDLRPVVTRYPIMINPMRTGSGLKNKVLEAFGLGLVVVTTPLGVDAIPQLVAGEHAVCASEAEELGRAVLSLLDDPGRLHALRGPARELVDRHYRWEVIGRTWRALVEGVRAPVSRTRR
jgi:glycosyltransferase involved in cell wall biosynthesis